jgi:hypothetical protein
MHWGIAAACFASILAAAGCKDEEKDYTCDEAMDKMYDEDCEMWCVNDGYTIYLDQCLFYDDGDDINFDQSLAEDICDELEDQSEDEECEGEFQDLLNCIVKHVDDDCGNDDCEDAWEDLTDCIW